MTEAEFLDALAETRDDGVKWRLDSIGRIRGTMGDYLDVVCPITAVCRFRTKEKYSLTSALAAARPLGIKFAASVMSAADNRGGHERQWRKMLLSTLEL